MNSLRNPHEGRRGWLRRPLIPYTTATVHKTTEENNGMLSKPIFVDQEILIQKMLPLDDNNNILINSPERLKQYHDMLLSRLTNSDKHDVRIHLRTGLFQVDIEQYSPYLEAGARLVWWQDEANPISGMQQDFLSVLTKKSIFEESFLVINAPYYSRLLAVWKDARGNFSGVLVTKPQTVTEICDYLDSVIQTSVG